MSQFPKVLWGLTPTIGWLSDILVSELKEAGFPALVDGGIVFGKAHLNARKAPPSIVATWENSGATGMIYGKEIAPSGVVLVPGQPVLNSLASDLVRLNFHCWAAADAVSEDEHVHADAVRFLAHQLWRVIHRGCEGAYRCLGIEPAEMPASTLGYRCVLKVELSTPVVDNLIGYLPTGIAPVVAVENESAEIAAFINLAGTP